MQASLMTVELNQAFFMDAFRGHPPDEVAEAVVACLRAATEGQLGESFDAIGKEVWRQCGPCVGLSRLQAAYAACREGETMSEPAEVFPVGHFITEELEARGWTITELATRMGVYGDAVAAVLSGEPLPDDWPEKLSRVFGTSAVVWRGLERRWQRRKGLTGETGPGDACNLGPGGRGHSGPKP